MGRDDLTDEEVLESGLGEKCIFEKCAREDLQPRSSFSKIYSLDLQSKSAREDLQSNKMYSDSCMK